VRSEGFYVNEKSTDTSRDRTSDLPICSTAPQQSVSSTCFEHPSVHPQEDLYMLFYGISFTHPYKQSGRWQDVLDTAVYRTACMDV